jgi:hypothetical protein
MNVKLLISVRHLLIDDCSEFNMPNFTISDNRKILSEYLRDANFIEAMGTNELKVPYYKSAFIYAVFPLKNHPTIMVNADTFIERHVMSSMVVEDVNAFLYALWYIKDNSVSVHHTASFFIELPKLIHSTSSFSFFTKQDGSLSDTYFSVDELNRTKELMNKEIAICPNLNIVPSIEELKSKIPSGDGINTKGLIEYDYSKLNRIERAAILLHTTRTHHFLPLRISFFIPFFECLFIASAGGEAQQKVCERIAFYLTDDKIERADIYVTIKEGYDIRSKFFHGDKLPSKYENRMVSISKALDDIARKLYVGILEKDHAVFLQEQKALEGWLCKLIFK